MNELEVTRHEAKAGESRLSSTDGVEVWTLNRPEVRNALDPALVDQLRKAVVRAAAQDTRVVLIKGNGPSFCAGADLRYLLTYGAADGSTPRDFLALIWDLTLSMEQSDIIFVAALHGHAIAGGLELALACDVVAAAQGTLIGDGHISNSLLPGGGSSARMAYALGRSTSTWLGLSGELLAAEHPSLGGWLRAVVSAEDLATTCDSIITTLLAAPADSQRQFKQLLRAQHPSATPEQQQRELNAFDRNWLDNNVPDALRRFLFKKREIS